MTATLLTIGSIIIAWTFFLMRASGRLSREEESNPLYSEQSLEAELSERLVIDLSGHTGRFNGERGHG